MLKCRSVLLAAVALAASSLVHAQGPAEPASVIRIAQASTTRKEPPTRAARSSEVRVRVLLLTDSKQYKNEEEYIEVGGVRYIHFSSPRLKARGRPWKSRNCATPPASSARKTAQSSCSC